MATLTVTNLTSSRLYLGEVYTYVAAGGTATITRTAPRIDEMEYLIGLRTSGLITIDAVIEPWEVEWRTLLEAVDGGYALANTTKVIHKPTITPDSSESAPGLGPQPLVIGSTIGLEYGTPATDAAYRIMKIDSTFAGDGSGDDASFHIHWTKSTDAVESGNTVRWQLDYTVFDGKVDDISGAPTTLQFDDTYTDGGTTSRIVHRTASVPAPGLIAGYYLGVRLTVIAGNTTLTGNPVGISCDLLFRNYVNT